MEESGSVPIDVIIAENTPLGAQSLADAVKRSHRFGAVRVASRADEVLRAVAEEALDIGLISAELENEPGRGFKLAQELSAAQSGLKLVMLLNMPDRDSVVQAFRVGSRGVFCRAKSVKDLTKCIACVQAGQIWATAEELGFLVEALREHPPLRVVNREGVPLLSPREMAVVQCVAEGLSNREAALQLKLSEHTVKNYMFRIFDKLGVSTRVELVLYVASQLQQSPDSRRPKSPPQALPQTTALVWCRQEAEKGVGAEQFRLAQRYREGCEVPVDQVAAYMWFLIAERSDPDLSAASRAAGSRLAAQMTGDQVAEARRRASAWESAAKGDSASRRSAPSAASEPAAG